MLSPHLREYALCGQDLRSDSKKSFLQLDWTVQEISQASIQQKPGSPDRSAQITGLQASQQNVAAGMLTGGNGNAFGDFCAATV